MRLLLDIIVVSIAICGVLFAFNTLGREAGIGAIVALICFTFMPDKEKKDKDNV